MKFQKLLLTAAVALVAFCGAIRAQDSTPPPPPAGADQGPPPGGRRGGGGKMMIERMKEKLSLTDEQVTQVTAIMKDEMKQGMALRNDTTLTPEDRRAKMGELRKANRAKIRALLNADQQKIFDAMPPMGPPRRGQNQDRPAGAPAPQ